MRLAPVAAPVPAPIVCSPPVTGFLLRGLGFRVKGFGVLGFGFRVSGGILFKLPLWGSIVNNMVSLLW